MPARPSPSADGGANDPVPAIGTDDPAFEERISWIISYARALLNLMDLQAGVVPVDTIPLPVPVDGASLGAPIPSLKTPSDPDVVRYTDALSEWRATVPPAVLSRLAGTLERQSRSMAADLAWKPDERAAVAAALAKVRGLFGPARPGGQAEAGGGRD